MKLKDQWSSRNGSVVETSNELLSDPSEKVRKTSEKLYLRAAPCYTSAEAHCSNYVEASQKPSTSHQGFISHYGSTTDSKTSLLDLDIDEKTPLFHAALIPHKNGSISTYIERPELEQAYIRRLKGDHESYELDSEDSESDVSDDGNDDDCNKFDLKRSIKVTILVLTFLITATFIVLRGENEIAFRQISVQSKHPYSLTVPTKTGYPVVLVTLQGAFLPEAYANLTPHRLSLDLRIWNGKSRSTGEVYSNIWEIPVVEEHLIGKVSDQVLTHNFNLKDLNLEEDEENASCEILLHTNLNTHLPLSIGVSLAPDTIGYSIIFAIVILVGLYSLIILELIPRALVAILAAVWAIGVLALLEQRPTMEEMVSWVDIETELLLFGMMNIVSIFGDTGFFDSVAMMAFKMAGGKIWPLITFLCFFTGFVSAFLDNVTCVLLLTPVSILLCKAMELDPRQILIAMVIFSNIGGAGTAVGDPPNVIIVNNKDVASEGISFTNFTLHMAPGVILVLLSSYGHLRLAFRDLCKLRFAEPYDVAELRREVEIWHRTANSLSTYSDDERIVRQCLLAKRDETRGRLKRRLARGQTHEEYEAQLLELQEMWRIRDFPLLIKSSVVLVVVIALFFLHSVLNLNVSLGMTSILGCVLLFLLADRHELDSILARVEWSTLIFFAALFIVMEALARMGLLDLIGSQTEELILTVDKEWRLTASILLIQWVSAIASAFIDNIPFTTMMIQIVVKLSKNPELGLPLHPLVYALAFGTCLGGNGTLIGASANVVCAGLAEQHGHRFTFMDFLKLGFPIMISGNLVASGYLLVCHSWLGWNS